MTENGQSASPDTSSRRRRSRSKNKQDWRALASSQKTDRYILYFVCLLAIVYLGLTAKLFTGGVETLGARGVNMNRGEMLYGFGNPALVQETAGGPWRELTDPKTMNQYRGWGYRDQSGGTFEVIFEDGSDKVAQLTCWNAQQQALACPDVLGVQLGDMEDMVAYRLGAPDQQTYRGQQKVMVYSDIGVKLTLRQFMVERIELTGEKNGFLGALGTYLRWIVP